MPVELPRGDRSRLDEDVTEADAVTARRLERSRSIEVGVGDLAGTDQDLTQWMRIAADARERDLAVTEEHDAFIVAQVGRHAQRSRLPAQVEQLEDIVDPELAEWAFDRH